MAATESAGDVASEDYFESYEDLDVHHLMLKDTVRIEVYRKAIQSSAALFKNKVVMDVGAGTGILSILCAQAGASTVYAVEPSSLANFIPEVAKENNFSEIIKVLKQRVEDVKLPADEKVDIIVSEWMGFYLLHEGMLDSVLVARDMHLKPEGKLFPEKATIWCAPCSLPQFYDFWDNVAGCRMQSIGMEWRKLKSEQPQIVRVRKSDLLTDAKEVCRFDLNTLTSKELDCISKSSVAVANRSGMHQGLCVWFECRFPTVEDWFEATVLSTAPGKPETHWKQTVIMLSNKEDVEESMPVVFELKLERSASDRRRYNIEFTELDMDAVTHSIPCKCYRTKCIVLRKLLEGAGQVEMDSAENDDEYAEKHSDPDSDDDDV